MFLELPSKLVPYTTSVLYKTEMLLDASRIIFDFKGTSETKQHINKDFISNVDIEGYQMYSQTSKSACGGVAIYVNNKLDHFREDDFSVIEDDFESL